MGDATPNAEPRARRGARPITRARRSRAWGNAAAGFTAVCALAVSAYTAYLQRQQVKAQAWPVLSWDYAATTTDDTAEFAFVLRNSGVGPALARAIEVRVDGTPVRKWSEVLRAIMSPDTKRKYNAAISDVHGRVIAAGEKIEPFSPHDAELARALTSQANRIEVSLCYCSVLEDCWLLKGAGDRFDEPRSLRSCARPAVPFEN
jgi:hypothetical protein